MPSKRSQEYIRIDHDDGLRFTRRPGLLSEVLFALSEIWSDLTGRNYSREASQFLSAIRVREPTNISRIPLSAKRRARELYIYSVRGGSEVDINSLLEFEKLRKLRISAHIEVRNIAALAGLRDLASLVIESRLDDEIPFSELPELVEIAINASRNVDNLHEGNRLRYVQLRRLSKSKPMLSSLKDLRWVSLVRCNAMVDLTILADCPSLNAVNLHYCSRLERLNGVEALTQLRTLTAEKCPTLADISALAALPKIRNLEFRDCKGLSDISPLGTIDSEFKISLIGNKSMERSWVQELEGMPNAKAYFVN